MKSNQLLSLKRLKKAAYLVVMLFALLLNAHTVFAQNHVSMSLTPGQRTNRCPGNDVAAVTFEVDGFVAPYTTYDVSWGYYDGANDPSAFVETDNATTNPAILGDFTMHADYTGAQLANLNAVFATQGLDRTSLYVVCRVWEWGGSARTANYTDYVSDEVTFKTNPLKTVPATVGSCPTLTSGNDAGDDLTTIQTVMTPIVQRKDAAVIDWASDLKFYDVLDLVHPLNISAPIAVVAGATQDIKISYTESGCEFARFTTLQVEAQPTFLGTNIAAACIGTEVDLKTMFPSITYTDFDSHSFEINDGGWAEVSDVIVPSDLGLIAGTPYDVRVKLTKDGCSQYNANTYTLTPKASSTYTAPLNLTDGMTDFGNHLCVADAGVYTVEMTTTENDETSFKWYMDGESTPYNHDVTVTDYTKTTAGITIPATAGKYRVFVLFTDAGGCTVNYTDTIFVEEAVVRVETLPTLCEGADIRLDTLVNVPVGTSKDTLGDVNYTYDFRWWKDGADDGQFAAGIIDGTTLKKEDAHDIFDAAHLSTDGKLYIKVIKTDNTTAHNCVKEEILTFEVNPIIDIATIVANIDGGVFKDGAFFVNRTVELPASDATYTYTYYYDEWDNTGAGAWTALTEMTGNTIDLATVADVIAPKADIPQAGAMRRAGVAGMMNFYVKATSAAGCEIMGDLAVQYLWDTLPATSLATANTLETTLCGNNDAAVLELPYAAITDILEGTPGAHAANRINLAEAIQIADVQITELNSNRVTDAADILAADIDWAPGSQIMVVNTQTLTVGNTYTGTIDLRLLNRTLGRVDTTTITLALNVTITGTPSLSMELQKDVFCQAEAVAGGVLRVDATGANTSEGIVTIAGVDHQYIELLTNVDVDDADILAAVAPVTWNVGANDVLGNGTLMLDELTTPASLEWSAKDMAGNDANIFIDGGVVSNVTNAKHPVVDLNNDGEYRIIMKVTAGGCQYFFYDTLLIVPTVDNDVVNHAVPTLAQDRVCLPSSDQNITLEITNPTEINWKDTYHEWYAETGVGPWGWANLDITDDGKVTINVTGAIAGSDFHNLRYVLYDTIDDHYVRYDNTEVKRCATLRNVAFTVSGKSTTTVATPGHDLLTGNLDDAEGICVTSADYQDLDELIANGGAVEFVGGAVNEIGPRGYFIDDFATPIVNGNMFNTEENGLTAGPHKIYIQTLADDGCTYKDSLEITVYDNTPLTAANFRLTDSVYNFCESLEAVDLINELADAAWLGEAYEYAGPLTGPGTNYTNVNTVSTNTNKSASPWGVFAFYPAAASDLTAHQITYSIRNEHKCATDTTFDITIEKQATMSLTSPLTTCNYRDTLVLKDELQAVGVTFDNGITVDYDKFTFTIDGKEETKILVNEYKDIDVEIEYQDTICASTKMNTTITVSEDLTALTVTAPASVCVGDNVDLADYVSLTDGDADEYFYIDGGIETDNGGSIYTVQSGITDFFWYYVKGDCKAKAVAFTLTPKEIFDGTEALAYTGTNYNKSLKAGETRTVNATLTTVGDIQGITVIKDGAAAPADLTVIPAAGVVSFTDGFGEYAFEFTDFCGNSFKDTLNIYETAELVSATVDATELCATTPVEFTVNFIGAVDSVKLYDAVADTVIDYVKDPVSPLTMNNVPAADTMTYKVQIVGKGYYEGVNELVNSDEMTVRQYITPVVAYDTITGGLPVKPTLCEGETVTLTATIEGDAQKVEWRDGTDVWNEFVGLYEITAQPNVHYGFRVTPFCGAATTDEFFFPQTLVPTEAPVLEYTNGDNDQMTICSTPNGTELLTVTNVAALNINVTQGKFYTVDNNLVTINTVADNGDYTANVLGEGSYIYVVTDSCGVEWRSNVIKITTVEAPTVTVVPDMATVCAGDVATFTLTTTGDIADTTFDNGSTIAGLKEGTTTITVTDICGVTATETVDIATYVDPTVTYTTPAEGSICAGETFTLAANVTGDAQKVEWKDGSNVWNEIVDVYEITASPEVHYGFRVISYCNDTTSKEFFYPATLVPAEEPVMSFNNGMNANLTVCAGGNGTLTIDNNAALNIDVTEGKFYKVNEATASVDAIADNGDWTATVGAGSYIYRFVDSCGTAHESNVIKVVEIEAPTVEVTPDANIVCAGQTVTFTIVTTGEDITVSYDNASTDAGLIAGTTVVTATDACGATATTTVDIATYVDPTVTYTTPAEGSICAGETFTLAANVTGDAQKVEWKDGSNVWNEIVDVYEITASPDVHYGFRVISYCNDTTSKEFFYPATLVPTEEPVMSFNNGMNANLTVCAGTPGTLTIDNAAALNIDVTEGKFYKVNEATASVDAIADNGDWTATVDAGSYIYKFVDSCGTAHESNVIKIVEIEAPTITVTPDADVVCAGGTVTFTLVETGEDVTHTFDNASTDAGLIAGTTQIVVTDACGVTDTATVTITELVDPTVTFVTPTDKSICAGETKEIVATVNNDYTSYVWEVNGVAQTLNEGTVAIAANDHAKFIVSYQCGADIDTVFSYPATQTIATTPVLTIDNAQICAGGTVTLTVTSDLVGSEANGEFYAAVSGGFDNTTKLTKAAVNDNFVTVTGVNDNTTYRYIVTDSCGNELTSNDVTVTLYEDVLAIVLPLDTMVCAGEETDLLAAISGDVQTITYDGNVVAALPATVGAGNHTIAIDDYCGTTTNIAFTIHEYNATTAVTLASAAPATLCADNNVQYELSFTVDGDDEIESIKWYQGYPTVSTEIVAAQDELTLSITKPATYYVAVKTSCNAADLMSNVVIPETQTIASIDLTADADTICAGATANLTLGGDVAVADSIAWYDVTTDMNNTTVLASGVATIAVPAGTYKAFVIDSCGTVFEKSITINEYVTPVVNSAVVASTKVCAGEETALTVDITGDIQNYTINGTPVTELPATLGEGTYDINVNDFCGNSIDVLDETVVAYVPTTSITFSEDMHFTLCAGTDNIPHNVYFTRNAGADDEITEIRWYKDGLQQDLNTDKEGNIFLIINEPAAYKVQIVTNCNTLAVDTDFVINPTVMVDANNLFINADALKICADSTTGVHLTGAEAAKTIAWYNITSDINSDAEIVANANLKDIVVSAGMYKAIVTDTCGNAYSRVVNIENFVTPYALTLNVEDTMICAGTTTNLTIAFEGEAKEVTVNNVATTDMTMAVAPGTYKIKVISNCEGDADLEDSITIAETPVVGTIAALGAIGTDTTVCQFSSFDLEVTDDAAAVEYVWANAQPTLQGWELLATGNKARVTTNQEESVVTVYAVDACGNHSDTVTYTLAVHTNPADVVPVVTVATDVACKDSLVTFTTDVIGDLDVYTWVATPAEALTEVTVSDDSNVAVYRMNEVGGSVTVTLSNVCGATVASAPAYVETALDPVLTFNVSKLAICDNETITLDVDVEGTDNYTITDDLGETYKIGETELMPHQNTTYTLTAINACGNVYTETATVTVTPLVDIDITYDQAQTTLFEGQGVVFTVTPANLPRYTYYFNNAEVSSTALNEVYVKPVPTNVNNTLRVVADNGNGCATDETINVFFGKEEMPNMFTPDGDGVNDVFMAGYKLKVWNRWGAVVYEGEDGWNGTFDNKGESMAATTYYYIVEVPVGAKMETHKGTVTLVRR